MHSSYIESTATYGTSDICIIYFCYSFTCKQYIDNMNVREHIKEIIEIKGSFINARSSLLKDYAA